MTGPTFDPHKVDTSCPSSLPSKCSCQSKSHVRASHGKFWAMKLVAPSLAIQKGEHGSMWERRVSEPTHHVHTPFCALFILHQS